MFEQSTEIVETVEITKAQKKQAWVDLVWSRHGGVCSNCGSDDHLSVRMIVPEEAGGRWIPSNGVLICRICEIARASVDNSKEHDGTPRRPVNVWISRKLYDNVKESLKSKNGFSSMGSAARYMIGLITESPSRFEDLEFYQDKGSEVKINLWIDSVAYEKFKGILNDRGMTVTDGIKGLMLLYTEVGTPSRRRS